MFDQRTRVGVVQTPHSINTAQIENRPQNLLHQRTRLPEHDRPTHQSGCGTTPSCLHQSSGRKQTFRTCFTLVWLTCQHFMSGILKRYTLSNIEHAPEWVWCSPPMSHAWSALNLRLCPPFGKLFQFVSLPQSGSDHMQPVCVCVCVYVCMCVCACVYVCVRAHVRVCVCT